MPVSEQNRNKTTSLALDEDENGHTFAAPDGLDDDDDDGNVKSFSIQ